MIKETSLTKLGFALGLIYLVSIACSMGDLKIMNCIGSGGKIRRDPNGSGLFCAGTDTDTLTAPYDDQPSVDSLDSFLEECAGTLAYQISEGEAETNSRGDCRYPVTYINDEPENTLALYLYRTHTNQTTGSNQEWFLYYNLAPGEELRVFGTKFTNGETDITEKAALLVPSEQCKLLIDADPELLEQIAVPIKNPCQ
jgi:hypothetical protein